MTEIKKLKTENLSEVTGGYYKDEMRICRRCGKKFLVTAAEQELSRDKGISFDYCRECKALSDISNHHPRVLYEVTCSRCGATAKVPFEPLPGQNVYCDECFSAIRG